MTQTVPQHICLLRLSAIGDCANVVPVIHTLQAARPDVKITWIINCMESSLVGDIPGVTCLSYDKKGGRAALNELKQQLVDRHFDVLLDMHASWRANRISRWISADRKIGFDKRRARDGQSLFVSERIPHVESRHVVDGFLAFAAAVGAAQPVYDWRVPIADADRGHAAELLGLAEDKRPVLFISPCSSHTMRNWQPGCYAAVADYAHDRHGLRCVLVGGPGALEQEMGKAIAAAMQSEPANLIGRTSMKQLLALFERGRILLTPDSGPAHMANATDIATISLHASTDPRRSGAYRSRAWCVDHFAEAAASYRNRTPDQLKWGTRIEDDTGVMELIPVSTVTNTVDRIMAESGSNTDGAENIR